MIKIRKTIIIITTILVILLIHSIYLNNQYNKFYKQVEENINIEAIIISNKKEGKYYNSYEIKGIEQIFKNKKFILYTKLNLDFGDKIKIDGTFYEPQEARNYKGFNYKKYLQTNKIYGTIKSKDIILISKNNVNYILTLSNNARQKIIKQIQEILPEETSSLLIGLTLGDKTYLEKETVQNFQKSSLAHILAVSGTHVSYIILGLTYLVTRSKIHKKYGYICIIFLLIFFLFLNNFSVSILRACIMSIILLLSKIFHRKANAKIMLLMALLITLAYNPYSINSLSLQLSYLGTIGVIFLSPCICELIMKLKINKKISKILSVTVSAQIAIAPIMVINFNTISLTFLISNLIAMPLLGVTIIFGFLLIFISFVWLWPAEILGSILNIILKILILIAKTTANFNLSNIYICTPHTITIIIYYLILTFIIYIFYLQKCLHIKEFERKILMLHYRYLKKNIIILLILIILIEFPYTKYNKKLKIYFIDVGQRR